MTTAFTEAEVKDQYGAFMRRRSNEKDRLERIFLYLHDIAGPRRPQQTDVNREGPLWWLKSDVPAEVKRLADMARVNMLPFVVDATAQVLYVDGFRAPRSKEPEPSWTTWQVNRLDAGQIGVHRAGLSYGAAYATVLPGTSAGKDVATISGAGPRQMTALYGDDPDWPEYAVEKLRSPRPTLKRYRVYDSQNVWLLEHDRASGKDDDVTVSLVVDHQLGFTPVIRFLTEVNEDGVILGDVEPLIPLQDQINFTTFSILVAQHYGAFRQRWIMGWTGTSETNTLQASVRKLWAFDDPDVKVGEFGQTDTSGMNDNREASLRHLATISQTPAHELLGQLVNLSAEALAAAEANHRRKVTERQTTFGESWEQVLDLAAVIDNQKSSPLAQVRWKDTEARSMAAMADALGKLVAGLGVPPQALWDRIPGVTQQDVEDWKAMAADQNVLAQMNAILAQQANAGNAEQPPVPIAPPV